MPQTPVTKTQKDVPKGKELLPTTQRLEPAPKGTGSDNTQGLIAKITVLDRKIGNGLGHASNAGLQLIALGASDSHRIALD